MTLLNCSILLKIAELGSLAKTAEYYSYSPSRISQVLTGTEKELGIKLFYRNGGEGLLPTREFQMLIPALKEMQISSLHFEENVNQLRNMDSGTIYIGSYTSMSCHWLPDKLKRFGKLYPKVSFNLRLGDSGQIAEWVQNGTVDIGLMEDPNMNGISFTELFEDPFMVIVSADHPMSNHEKVSYREIDSEQFIFLEPEDNKYIENILLKKQFYPTVKYRVKDDYTIMSMVEAGLGISILPNLVLARTPYKIKALKMNPHHIRRLGIAIKANQKPSIAAQRFFSFLTD